MGIKTRTIQGTDWINNYWYVDDYLYVTNSSFDNPRKNILGRISCDHLIDNLKDKKSYDRSFIASPDPLVSGAVNASITDVELVNYYRGFIYNVFKYDDVLYVSVIRNDKDSYVIAIDENGKEHEVNQYKNYLVVGEINNKLVLKSVETRETYLVEPVEVSSGERLIGEIDDSFVETKIRRIKRICYLADKYVILNDLNHLYTLKRGKDVFTTLKDDEDEINICNFDKSSFVISERETRKTYVVNKKNEQEPICNNYFYRLDCYNKILLIGKPLFTDNDWIESYTLPLMFIN